jgi:hypothetical protein
MDTSLFQTGIDASQPPNGPCYVDGQGLPSMLHVPVIAGYPLEQTDIAALYPNIVAWAASGGVMNADWYAHPQPSSAYPNPVAPRFGGSPDLPVDTTCACPSGYSGNGGSCIDIDECATGANDCAVNATCVNNQGGFGCTCNSGFMGDGRTCVASGPPAPANTRLAHA